MDRCFQEQLNYIEKNRNALQVRYVKLGRGGVVAEECFKNNLLHIGYDTHDDAVRDWCNQARILGKRKSIEKLIKTHWKQEGRSQSTATNFTNSVLAVAEDTGNVLWVTFHNRRVYYGLTDGGGLESRSWEGALGSAKKMRFGWCDRGRDDQILFVNKLSGSFTKTHASQGTIAAFKEQPAKYFIRHILSEPLEIKQSAVLAKKNFQKIIEKIVKDLQPSEFETLIDLIFSNSGWKRDGELGGNTKFVDVTLMLPSTGETAAVQVKTATNQKEAQKYIGGDYSNQGFDKFFYIYHTGHVKKPKDDPKCFVWDLSDVAEKAIDAGLSQWVIDRAHQ